MIVARLGQLVSLSSLHRRRLRHGDRGSARSVGISVVVVQASATPW